MKSSRYFLLIICLISHFSQAQCVSIELSIDWEKGENALSDAHDTTCIPYLSITYRNYTDIPLYFLKVSKSRMELPQINSGVMMETTLSSYEKAKTHLDYSNNYYQVEIGGPPYYGQVWQVINDTITANVIETDIINNDLADIYNYIFEKLNLYYRNDSAIYVDFKASDITEYGILTKLRNEFVFLKAGEHNIDRYDLIGFKTVGGHFVFNIQVDSLNSFVYTEPVWNNNRKEWIYPKTVLPNKINEYALYMGKVYTNTVGLKFNNQYSEK